MICIDYADDGNWVMSRAQGVFNPRTDHCIAVHRDGRIRGGVVFTGYLGSAIVVHMAGDGTNWATRDFLWMVYDYSFNQLGVKKLIGLVQSSNLRAIAIDLRMGFRLEATISDIFPDGSDLLVLVMEKINAKWLNVKPRHVFQVT